MNRRVFMSCSFGWIATALAAEAQPARSVYRVGCLWVSRHDQIAHLVETYEAGLRDLGYHEGSNLVLERRFADGKLERLPELAAELVRLKPDVIMAATNAGITAAKQATTTIPIVMTLALDPANMGFIQSLSRPGGNLTGITFDTAPETVGKNVELLKQLSPTVSRLDIMWNPAFPGRRPYVGAAEAAARRLGVAAYANEVRTAPEVDNALAFFNSQPSGGLFVISDPVSYSRRHEIAAWGTKNRRPTVSDLREYAEAGGLTSYGASMAELYKRVPYYVDRILKGTKPADLPVEQPTRFELVINRKTAQALGLAIPPSLLLRADHVLE